MASITLSHSFPPMTTSTLTITEASRNASTTNFNLSFSTNLGYSASYSAYGYTATVSISASGMTTQSRTYTLKEEGPTWSGTATHTSTFNSNFSIPGNISSVTVSVGFKWSDDSYVMSGSTSMNLTKLISKIQSVGYFNDTDTLTLSITKYSNSYTHTLNVYKRTASNTADTSVLYATRTGVENGDTFQFTNQELDNLYTINQNTTMGLVDLAFVLTTYSGSTALGTSLGQGRLYISNAYPIFTDFDISDVNSTTVALTGDNSKFIKGYSTLEALITVANKAIPVKNAVMVSYSSSGGEIASYSDNQDVAITIQNYSSPSVVIHATDSRTNSAGKTKTVDLINYEDIAITNTPSIARQSSTGEATTINIQGTFWNDTFGSVTNSLNVTYKYKVSGSSVTHTPGTTVITPTISNNTFTINQSILGDTNNGFDADKSYEVVVTITDELSSYEIVMTLQAGIPAFAVYGNKMSIGDKYDETLGGTQLWGDVYLNSNKLLSILDIYPVGSLYMTTSNMDPNVVFGGTWAKVQGDAYLKIVTSNAHAYGGTSSEHKIPASSMPSHRHVILNANAGGDPSGWNYCPNIGSTNRGYANMGTEASGGGQPYYPYYYGIYVWRRTA